MNRSFRLVLVLLLFISTLSARAQDRIPFIEQQIDSLRALKAELDEHLHAVTMEIETLESKLQQVTLKEHTNAEGVLISNMDASLRDAPTPGAQVIRTIPQHTMLEAIDFNGAYWKVRYENSEGWVMRMFVNEGEGAEAIKTRFKARSDENPVVRLASSTSNYDRAGKPLLITGFDISTNTAGGISIQYAFEHLDTTRSVREITFLITPYNDEGMVEPGKNSGVSTRRLRRFGPVTAFDGLQRYQFENVWYNEDISCIQLDQVRILYDDGTRRSYSHDIDKILAGDITNQCQILAAENEGQSAKY